MERLAFSALATLLVAVMAAPASAQVLTELDVYDDTTTAQGPLVDIVSEIGDEIELLSPASGSWTVTEFEVGYVGFFPENGNERMVVRFRANDGPGGEPGTVLYQSAPQPIVSPDSFSVPETLVLTGLSVVVPLDFTWTVVTTGLANIPGDVASVTSFGPPTVGSSDETQYWLFTQGNWLSSTLFTDKSNFYARVRALPEPGAFSSLVAGAVLLLALGRWRSRRSRDDYDEPDAAPLGRCLSPYLHEFWDLSIHEHEAAPIQSLLAESVEDVGTKWCDQHFVGCEAPLVIDVDCVPVCVSMTRNDDVHRWLVVPH